MLAPATKSWPKPYYSLAASADTLWIFFHNALLIFSSTSSASQLYLIEFWHISSAETATPPALTALEGAAITPGCFVHIQRASFVVGILATSI